MKKAVNRYVVLTTDKDKRGVFFGKLVKLDTIKGTASLADAQMAVYWSVETRGVLGLASIGPQKGSRITPIVPIIELCGVTSISDATPEAVKQWKLQLWT